MMIQIQVERTLESCLIYIETFIALDNGQMKPHLHILCQCPGYDLKWVPMIYLLERHKIDLFPFMLVMLNL